MTTGQRDFVPDEIDEDDAEEPSNVLTMAGEEDIDPGDWLSGTDASTMVDYFILRDGRRLKLMAITDGEEHQIRLQSSKPNPSNPRGGRVLEGTKYRRNVIAASLNKAYGYKLGDPKFITERSLIGRPVGELTQLLEKVMEISGMPTQSRGGNTADGAIDFFG